MKLSSSRVIFAAIRGFSDFALVHRLHFPARAAVHSVPHDAVADETADGTNTARPAAIVRVQNDELDVSAPGGAYVRNTPDKLISDNLLQIATPEDP